MNEVTEHYTRLLAPVYLWMAGGADAALAQGSRELAALELPSTTHAEAIDLGAGFGMHAIPMARLGYRVTAIDTSGLLLEQLRQLDSTRSVRTIEADLLTFTAHVRAAPHLILCMTDTLTHLPTPQAVERLCAAAAATLAPGGRFVATFRDYTQHARGDARFIPVRGDADRIHTCFIEDAGDRVRVHDILHERVGDAWRMHVSHYPKLRLHPPEVARHLTRAGLDATLLEGPRGMAQIIAARGI